MSLLIQMRQRLKAIETIKKITQAMRLISMSTHTKLKNKKDIIDNYSDEIIKLFSKIKKFDKTWQNPFLNPQDTTKGKILIILIGSQKGLCGNFNTNLFYLFEKNLRELKKQDIEIISIGKKASEYLKIKKIKTKTNFDEFTPKKIISIANSINDIIINTDLPYRGVVCYSSFSKSFFIQKQKKSVIIPLTIEENNVDIKYSEELLWEQKPQEILDFLSKLNLNITLQKILIQSLIAEQAARFIAMDNSTRNAESLLESSYLSYNKARQAKITKELTDLSAIFLKNM